MGTVASQGQEMRINSKKDIKGYTQHQRHDMAVCLFSYRKEFQRCFKQSVLLIVKVVAAISGKDTHRLSISVPVDLYGDTKQVGMEEVAEHRHALCWYPLE